MEHDLISRIGLLEDLGASCYDLNALTGVTGDERTLQEAIMQYPAVDAVPVVRCGECRWYDSAFYCCSKCGVCVNRDFYCADGARMDAESEEDTDGSQTD